MPLQPVCHIKGPASAVQGKAGVGGHASAGHGIKDQVFLFLRNSRGCVRSICAGDTPRPVVSESLVAIVHFPLVPCPQPPAKPLESFKIFFIFQGE